MFHLLLGIELPSIFRYIDTFVTGLIIGTGSVPVHSLIGLLQNTKDAVYEARTLWKGKAQLTVLQQIMEELKTSQAEQPSLSNVELRRYIQHLLR